jgi:hypothetical protein
MMMSAILLGLITFNAPVMAANDSGRITFIGQIVDGDSPCHIGYAHNDQTVALSAAKATAFSLKVNRCGLESLSSITASFRAQNADAMIIKNSGGAVVNTTPRALLLSHNRTVDFTVSANPHSHSGISQLTLAYE